MTVRVEFAKAFQRHVPCPPLDVAAASVATALDAYFAEHPAARGYVVDERGVLRRHVAVFVNRDLITDRETLSDPVSGGDRIHVFQALSGGT